MLAPAGQTLEIQLTSENKDASHEVYVKFEALPSSISYDATIPGHLFADQRVLVMMPTLASIRDTLRLLAIPNGPAQPRRAVVVLNRSNMQGGLDPRRVAEALKMQPDIIIRFVSFEWIVPADWQNQILDEEDVTWK